MAKQHHSSSGRLSGQTESGEREKKRNGAHRCEEEKSH